MDERGEQQAFGRRLRALRRAAGMTMQELASELAISYSYMRSLESGIRSPSIDLLSRMAAVLGTTTDVLLGRGDLAAEVQRIERRRAAETLYGPSRAERHLHNVEVYTSLMHDIDQLDLPEHVKQQIREDIRRAMEAAGEILPDA